MLLLPLLLLLPSTVTGITTMTVSPITLVTNTGNFKFREHIVKFRVKIKIQSKNLSKIKESLVV